MIMSHDLQLQISEYEKLDDFYEKVHFVENIVAYYKNHKDDPCYTYWNNILDYLYFFGFNYY